MGAPMLSGLLSTARQGLAVVILNVFGLASQAQTLTTLLRFSGANGVNPQGPLVQGADGELWGTTFRGGVNDLGTVFKVTRGGSLASLHSFTGEDGDEPAAGLILATDGNFYGTASDNNFFIYVGTVFQLKPDGTFTSFSNTPGAAPLAPLIEGCCGIFYGTASRGGANVYYGTVFSVNSAGAFTDLHDFDATDGGTPVGGLTLGGDGNLYGTTQYYGNSGGFQGCGGFACGVVFKITTSGTLTVIANFEYPGGQHPIGTMLIDPNGYLFGTTVQGGNSTNCKSSNGGHGCGTIFRVAPDGTLKVVHSFDLTDGSSPTGSLVWGTDGNFYGTTISGGANGYGTIFRFTRDGGVLTTLYNFDSIDGSAPGPLMQATDGNFYGVTASGGPSGDGTIFMVSVGLGPFVRSLPVAGRVGKPVTILGTDLSSATSVSFNGEPAAFRINASGTAISTTVPVGATSGKIEVAAASGNLQTNVPFVVLR